MINQEISRLINEQITNELYSAYLYLDMSNYFYEEGLDGFGNWYKIQAQEEVDHAMLMLRYLQNNGEKVELNAINKPDKELKCHIEVLKVGLNHEILVTSLIHNIYQQAYLVKDFRTMQFMDWFVKEQGEEEKNAEDLIKKYQLFAGDSKGLYMLDNELKARVYAAPSLILD